MNIGKILGVASSQHIILRTFEWSEEQKIPRIGDSVYTPRKEKIGKIADIFGPVKKPMISVKLFDKSDDLLIKYQNNRGKSLYTLPSSSKSSNYRGKTRKFRHLPRKRKYNRKYNPRKKISRGLVILWQIA